MFEPSDTPRVFGSGLGVDFPKSLVEGLKQRLDGHPPEAMARVQIIVNTTRMQRRIKALFAEGGAAFLPKLMLLSDIGASPEFLTIPKAVPALSRRMELIALVSKLLDAEKELAPRSSLFDLADSLAGLLDEMQGEGVSIDAIHALETGDQSGHWARAKKFIEIAAGYLDLGSDSLDAEARQRAVVQAQIQRWENTPPQHPVILAGSTGSRGTTALLMKAIARLPQGAVILPGFDRDMPEEVWRELITPRGGTLSPEDHPQYRFAKFLGDLGLEPTQVPSWRDTPPCDAARNRVVSLALRPVPVTDGWLRDGPGLGDLPEAMAGVTLVQCQNPREEALTIAMRLRKAAEDGKTAALITPDRMLTRQVTAALDRWDITPDDSAGLPLQLSPPGRLLRHTADLLVQPLTAESLLTILKHPLTHTGQDRGPHLLLTRELELRLRRYGPAFPDADSLRAWGAAQKIDGAEIWADWVARCLCAQERGGAHAANALFDDHISLTEQIAAGPGAEGSGELWSKAAGREAAGQISALKDTLDLLPDLSARDYADLFGGVLSRGEVRDRDAAHPNVLIWGTLEARVQGANLLILSGLNEGSWPEAPAPDPWLNRKMRFDAGLLLPERRIGLSAHDFQQAIAAPEVWLTRAVRSEDAETVPSRWLNRLTNLLQGLEAQRGPDALAQMRARGQAWISRAEQLEEPINARPAPRPAPRPPVDTRPRQLSVTEIKTLVRDPYAIYAKHVLGLRPLDSFVKSPDYKLRGIVKHEVFEKFVAAWETGNSPEALLDCAKAVFEDKVDWPSARLLWEVQIARIASEFIAQENERRAKAMPTHFEIAGAAHIGALGFTLKARADRIDMSGEGAAYIYDYKTGALPSKKVQKAFDKQLLLTAAMVLRGAFENLHPRYVEDAVYLGVGSKLQNEPAPLKETPPDQVWAEFEELIATYLSPEQSFSSRRAMQQSSDEGDYDLLARYGEWDDTAAPSEDGVTP